jgi:hypothetical protein
MQVELLQKSPFKREKQRFLESSIRYSYFVIKKYLCGLIHTYKASFQANGRKI